MKFGRSKRGATNLTKSPCVSMPWLTTEKNQFTEQSIWDDQFPHFHFSVRPPTITRSMRFQKIAQCYPFICKFETKFIHSDVNKNHSPHQIQRTAVLAYGNYTHRQSENEISKNSIQTAHNLRQCYIRLGMGSERSEPHESLLPHTLSHHSNAFNVYIILRITSASRRRRHRSNTFIFLIHSVWCSCSL